MEVESKLVKHWLQGQLKLNRQIFDHPFNTEIIRVSSEALFSVLESIFDKKSVDTLRTSYSAAKKITGDKRRAENFPGWLQTLQAALQKQ